MPSNIMFPNSVYHNSVCPSVGDVYGTDCDYTLFSDRSKIPFIDGVPATGDLYSTVTGLLIGYRDPTTFVFTPEPGTAEIFELDGFNVSTGIVPKFNTLSAIAVKWLNALGVEQNDTEPVIAHTYATDVDVTRDNSDAVTYSHKTGLPIPSLKSYYLDDGVTEVDFLGVYEVPHTVSNPIKFGWTITNGNVGGAVEQIPFSATVDAGATETLTLPVFTDDWGNSATLVSREYTLDREQAVSITVPLEGALSNEATEIITWINKYGITVNDVENMVDHETATDVSIIRGDVGNQDTVTISHKTGLPIPALLYYRDDANTRVDFNGVYEVPNTVATPVTLGWSITNGNISTEVEQTEFSELLVIDTENEITMPTFTDNWGNAATLLSRTITVAYGDAGGYESPYAVDNDAVMNWDALNTDSFIITDGTPDTLDDWADSGTASTGGLMKAYSTLPPTYEDNGFGVLTPKGNNASARGLEYNETGLEVYRGSSAVYSLVFSFIYYDGGVNDLVVLDRQPDSDKTEGGFFFTTASGGSITFIRWNADANNNWQDVFYGYADGDLVTMIMTYDSGLVGLYSNLGTVKENLIMSPMLSTDVFKIMYGKGNSWIPDRGIDSNFNQLSIYPNVLDATTRATYFSEIATKYGGA